MSHRKLLSALLLCTLPFAASALGAQEKGFSGPQDPDGPAPANDLCVDAIGPLAVPSYTFGSTVGSTFDDVPQCDTSVTTGGVWYTFVGTGSEVVISTCSSNGGSAGYDSKLTVFSGVCNGLDCKVGNDDNCNGSNPFSSTVRLCAQRDIEYHVLVHGFGGATGNFNMSIVEDGGEGCDTLAVPTASSTGLVVLALALLSGGVLLLARKRRSV
ncbi:MAG: hypothetical protein AB7G12_15405 [Thermoanaerobaculia bacterium]